MLSYISKGNYTVFIKQKIVNLIGVASKAGQMKNGPEMAPQILREAGIQSVIENLGWEVKDHGNLNDFIPTSQQLKTNENTLKVNNDFVMGSISKNLHDFTYESCQHGQFPLILGGDHSIATGSISGVLKHYSNIKIVWIDAHADINTPASSPSGNYHGMPVAHLLGIFGGKVHGFQWFEHLNIFLKPENIIYIGLRDIDPPERKIIKEQGIKAYSMSDVQEIGIANIMKNILQQWKDQPIHCSYDIDGIDPYYCPGTGTRVRGGLNYREAHYILNKLHDSGQLVSMDLVEYNPLMDIIKEDYTGDVIQKPIGKSAHLCLDLVRTAFGYKLL